MAEVAGQVYSTTRITITAGDSISIPRPYGKVDPDLQLLQLSSLPFSRLLTLLQRGQLCLSGGVSKGGEGRG